ncbi:UBC-like protein [Trichocladium antarcticum]|uniref:UBC-like protein n=1 Tax=Trichocladium antarcticum TaxID=1450529 RepID=A0AAN6UKJ0_9PEZI|nr:UBC-like protein [Trichocladium antarcticum]
MSSLPAMKRQHLLAEFAGLKQACPQGIYVSLTPGDPTRWSGVIFVRKGPYAPAILRFHIAFPDTYPLLPPLVTFATDMFHPLITPLTTYMYSTDIQHNGTVSASDDERLPPGGFSLRHGFGAWFGRSRAAAMAKMGEGGGFLGARSVSAGSGAGSAVAASSRAVVTATGTTPRSVASEVSSPSSSSGAPGFSQTTRREVSTYEVLSYIRSTFDDEDVLDAVPLEAAGNPGAWHAWRTHRRLTAGKVLAGPRPGEVEVSCPAEGAATTRRPDEWNWEGVWEERVRRGIAASLSEGVLFGNAGWGDEVINFLSMDDADIEAVKSNLLRTLGAGA